MLLAEKENARKRQQAQKELQRATAQAQHEHDMAILKARRLEAVAKGKLDAINYSMEQEGHVFPLTTGRCQVLHHNVFKNGSEPTGPS